MFDDAAFCRLLDVKGVKMKAAALSMGIKTSTLYRKRKGESDFLRSEIQRFSEFMQEDVNHIFFANKVT